MGLIIWLTIGCICGFLATCAINRGGAGFWACINVGMGSAFLGGLGASMAGWHGVQVVEWHNILVSLACAIIGLIWFRRAWIKYGWQFEPLPDET